MLKAIIFDVGGTLLGATDLFENILAANTRMEARQEIYTLLAGEFMGRMTACRKGSPFKKIVEIISEAVEAVNKEHHGCLLSVDPGQVYWKTFVDNSFVIHDADTVLGQLKARNVKLFIASDADAELIYAEFEKHQWSAAIDRFFISSEIRAYKPHDSFVAALNSAIEGYEKQNVILVGDSQVDIETGKKLGVRTGLVGSRGQKRYGEDYCMSSLLELLAW